jgi:hypothetical protein
MFAAKPRGVSVSRILYEYYSCLWPVIAKQETSMKLARPRGVNTKVPI